MCFELNRYDTFILLLMLIQFCLWILHFAERGNQVSPRGSGQKSTANNLSSPRQFTQATTVLVLLLKLSKTAPKRRKTFSKAIFFVALCESVFWLFDNYDSQSPRGALRWHFRLTKTTPNNLFWIYIWQNSLSSPNKTATYSSSSFAN